MNIPLKETTEITANRLADSPLGKLSAGKAFDQPMIEYDKPLGLINENINNCPLEGNNGRWDGERGNGDWHPDRDYVPGKANPEGKTWGKILGKHGTDHISFKDGKPDFSEICKGTVKIDGFSDVRTDNFDKADAELARQSGRTPEDVAGWRKENGYTWHECNDMKTMQAVPSEIHNNISHRGGISEVKKGNGEQ
ncbi:MAG: HNH endonuclease [Planctomycetota bacterium]|jgi:hypothetical protein|nr:HNH endonuclease [Planctomycetota bacterium]